MAISTTIMAQHNLNVYGHEVANFHLCEVMYAYVLTLDVHLALPDFVSVTAEQCPTLYNSVCISEDIRRIYFRLSINHRGKNTWYKVGLNWVCKSMQNSEKQVRQTALVSLWTALGIKAVLIRHERNNTGNTHTHQEVADRQGTVGKCQNTNGDKYKSEKNIAFVYTLGRECQLHQVSEIAVTARQHIIQWAE